VCALAHFLYTVRPNFRLSSLFWQFVKSLSDADSHRLACCFSVSIPLILHAYDAFLDCVCYSVNASSPLKHGRNLRPGKKRRGGTKIMHIFMKVWGVKETLRGKERLSYFSTCLHCIVFLSLSQKFVYRSIYHV